MLKDKNITLYSSPSCGMCMALKLMLTQKGIKFNLNMDLDELTKLGITHVPVLEVEGNRYDFPEAMKLIREEK